MNFLIIQIKIFNLGPGGYTTCGILPIERYDNKTVKYFKAHKNLKWISNNAYEDFADYVPVTSVITMYVGRVNLNLGNGTYQEIGKVWQGELSYYDASSATFQNTKFFDYLACTAEKTTTLNANLYSLNFGLESSCVSENITSLNPKKPTYSCGKSLNLAFMKKNLSQGFLLHRYPLVF